MTNSRVQSSQLSDDVILIIENIGEGLTINATTMNGTVLEGVCAVFGAPNNNRRVYEKEEYLPHLSYLKEKIEKRQLVGDLDHPQHFDVTLKSASHIIEGLEYDGSNKVNIRLRILEHTPNGKIAKALLDGGVSLSISSRSAGTVNESGIVKLQRIFTYDLVGEPGFTEAILRKTINESLKHEFQMITESYTHLKESSIVASQKLEDISESLGFANNFKVYKINKKDNELVNMNLLDKNTKKNSKNMNQQFITLESMDKYSEVLKSKFASIKKELADHKTLILEKTATTTVNDTDKLYEFMNYLAEQLEGVINFSDYLSKKLNESVKYTEHVAETSNNAVEFANYLGEAVNKSIKHQDHIVEKLNQSIGYSDYLKNSLTEALKYQKYLGEELDKGLQYTEYVAKGSNLGIEYAENLSKEIQHNRSYAEYISEKLTQTIGYAEYVSETFNVDGPKVKRNVLGNVNKLDESVKHSTKNPASNGSPIDELVSKVDQIIVEVRDSSAQSVLESRYPFLKVLDQPSKDTFFKLESQTRQAIVEAVGASVWFNQSDVLGIMEAVVSHKNKDIPNVIKFMPAEYKETWNVMNESEKSRVFSKSQLYTVNTPYQVKSFWDELDLRGINDRVETEKSNNKLTKINENQSPEGLIPVKQVVEMTRGYSQEYLDRMTRQSQAR